MSNSPVLRPQNCHERKIWCFYSFGVRILREIINYKNLKIRLLEESLQLENHAFQLSSNLFSEGDSLNHFFWFLAGEHLGNACFLYQSGCPYSLVKMLQKWIWQQLVMHLFSSQKVHESNSYLFMRGFPASMKQNLVGMKLSSFLALLRQSISWESTPPKNPRRYCWWKKSG